MKYIVVLLLLCVVRSEYDPKMASDMAYLSKIVYDSFIDVQIWNCTDCKRFNMTMVSSIVNPAHDTQTFVGYNPDWDAVVVGFRGNVDVRNWIIELDLKLIPYSKCQGCLIHEGFVKAYKDTSAVMNRAVQLLLAKYQDAKIYVCGHNLGGALAVVAALDLMFTFGRIDALYTYGQPRVGNGKLASYIDKQLDLMRIIHYADILTHVPPMDVTDYRHAGTQFWFTEDMQKYKVCSAEDPTCSASLTIDQLTFSDMNILHYIKIPDHYTNLQTSQL